MGIWYLLKDLSHSIHKATNTSIDPFKSLPTYLNPNRLNKISMAPPCILIIEGFSQNMLLSTTTLEEVHKLFKMAQSVGLEVLESIGEVKRCCESIGGCHSWHWDNPKASTVTVCTCLPLSEGQEQIKMDRILHLVATLLLIIPHLLMPPRPSFFTHTIPIGPPTILNITLSLHSTLFLILLLPENNPIT
jgi:hypothetical protein